MLRGRLARWAEAAGPAPRGFETPDAAAHPPPEPDARARARAVLEVGPDAGADEIRSAYRRLCRRYHPDRFDGDPARAGAANELLAEINAAYALLEATGR